MKISKVIKVINFGGFGKIEEVICDDNKHYAKKTFNPSDAILANAKLYEQCKTRFIREVKTQKLLPKEYFMPILHENLDDHNPWFIMPLADGVYSEEIVNAKIEGRLPNGLGDILNSLEFIHKLNLVHRDLKPPNILLHEGIWKLADFGLISHDKDILSLSITTTHQAYGTALYCAPEQLMEFKRVTPAADIYSFGAILHDIFSDGKRVPHSELTGKGEIGVIIEKCTKREIRQRFNSIESIRNKLLYILSKESEYKIPDDVANWISILKDLENIDADKFENIVFFLKRNVRSRQAIFYELTKETLKALAALDKDIFNDFCLLYQDWVFNSGFQYDYCDVVIGFLKLMYENTLDLEIKTKVVLASAELARSHNRWYVMRQVLSMADHEISDELAFRIGIELEIDPLHKTNLKRCVQGINLNIKAYHSKIAEVLII